MHFDLLNSDSGQHNAHTTIFQFLVQSHQDLGAVEIEECDGGHIHHQALDRARGDETDDLVPELTRAGKGQRPGQDVVLMLAITVAIDMMSH